MSTLLIGFDSAWSATNCGAIVGALSSSKGVLRALGPPQTADYKDALRVIRNWQSGLRPTSTIILLDQPTIVGNASGQRPVENIVASLVSRRYGGMQPANTSRKEMFGRNAPVWSFLEQFGGAADPLDSVPVRNQVFETYPVLAMIALGWTLRDSRVAGRLPKYNPQRKKTFLLSDWQYVCGKLSDQFKERRLNEIFQWLETVRSNPSPRKTDQDNLDSCSCLLVALHLVERKDCLMVGDWKTGYIIVPASAGLRTELEVRCTLTGLVPSEWVRAVRLPEMPLASRVLATVSLL